MKFQFTLLFKTILNVDEWNASDALWLLGCMWRSAEGRQLGTGLGTLEICYVVCQSAELLFLVPLLVSVQADSSHAYR